MHHDVQDHGRLYGGMLMLRLLARKYEFKDDTEREPLAHIMSTAFPPLLAIFQVRLPALTARTPQVANLSRSPGHGQFWGEARCQPAHGLGDRACRSCGANSQLISDLLAGPCRGF